MALSPMMQQYFNTKSKYPDCILMFRLGDFYELFFEDAKTVSRELELVLTGKDCGLDERAPMCGVPFHAVEGYLTKLVAKGYRVAICEQVEDPALAKGLVKRDVVRVVSPGTVIEGSFLAEDRNNYICSVYVDYDSIGAVFADITTGEMNATSFNGDNPSEALFAEAAAYSPRELVCNKATSDEIKNHFFEKYQSLITQADESVLNEDTVSHIVSDQFGDIQLGASSPVAFAAAALLSFLKTTQKTDISYIKSINTYNTGVYLSLDLQSRKSLEITETIRSGEKRGSLLWVLDKTKTAAGARLLRQWVEKPLLSVSEIHTRQEAVAELFSSSVPVGEITDALKKAVDIERLLTRLIYGTANARDLVALQQTVEVLPRIKENLRSFASPLLKHHYDELDLLSDIGESISNTICENPPVVLREGGIIKQGASAAVDELRAMMSDGKNFIARIEQTEKERTGIRTLKVGYNKVFGYYIEVSKSFISDVPESYIRRQTLANCERYVTEELKEMEGRIIGAKDKDGTLEYELFMSLREHILASKNRIKQTAVALANIDALCSLATVARENNYSCPEVDLSDTLYIKNSRHPVVEKFTKEKYFVPNDCDMDCRSNRTMLITGPNMAGKSTYMRQIALCILMAQIGSFIPASEARIGICDKIFTRIGASDDLSGGNSTFMLEMREVASILKHATKQSFIIYDEIGRGTSTFDGMSIARSVLEYTTKRIGARTMFATHYHELTSLEQDGAGIKNYNIAAKKRGNEIIFLRKIIRGGTDDSYGIEVASLAGVPKQVVTEARAILKALEASAPINQEKPSTSTDIISFDDITEQRIIEKLGQIDINTLTPIEAIGILYELKKLI